jgi:hypothetical protein
MEANMSYTRKIKRLHKRAIHPRMGHYHECVLAERPDVEVKGQVIHFAHKYCRVCGRAVKSKL